MSESQLQLIIDAAGLCQSEANRWNGRPSCQKTADHWQHAATELKATYLLAHGLIERVAELEATAARRLELLRELRDSFCAAAKLPSREPNVKMIREMGHYLRLIDRVDAEISAAAEVAAGEKTNGQATLP
jgi:hypothetical protein